MDTQNNISQNKVFLESLNNLLKEKAEKLMLIFIQQGPEILREQLNITLDKHWNYVFDYLVFSEEILKKCVIQFMPFFKNLVAEKGPMALKAVFDLEDEKYEPVFERLMDLVGVAHGAVYEYVYSNKQAFVAQIMSGKAKKIRMDLGLENAKYDSLWYQILEILQEAVCSKVYDDKYFENGLKAFDNLINALRQHRSLKSYKDMWSYSSKVGE